MKKILLIIALLGLISLLILSLYPISEPVKGSALSGAFLADRPKGEDIISFKETFGKRPYLIMVFIDWDNYIEESVIEAVYSQDSLLFLTWEPWRAVEEEAIDYKAVLKGESDSYIDSFALRIKDIAKTVFLRFGHEMNGDWYPWSGIKIGPDTYKALYRYIKDRFDALGVRNVSWVFSVNNEDIPPENSFERYYPGDSYVDYIGIDGYNWGDTQSWSSWISFEDIFMERYMEAVSIFDKPLIISEFSSTSSGGDKSSWIREALDTIKKMDRVEGFVLFNLDKESDWSFKKGSKEAEALKESLASDYFKDIQYP